MTDKYDPTGRRLSGIDECNIKNDSSVLVQTENSAFLAGTRSTCIMIGNDGVAILYTGLVDSQPSSVVGGLIMLNKGGT
jgi:hypothetical protein